MSVASVHNQNCCYPMAVLCLANGFEKKAK